MSGLGIGTSDRGTFDREDNLYLKNKNPLKVTKSAQEAEAFAKLNSGAEAIIKTDNDDYVVYQIETSEENKNITNEDFTNDSIKLNGDVAKLFSNGKKAYTSTSDNIIRSLEIGGVRLPDLEHKFANANLKFVLEDKDGIDTKSKNDLEGSVSGNVKLSKEGIEYSLNKLSEQLGVDLELKAQGGEYTISASKGVPIGKIHIKGGSGGLDVKLDESWLVTGARIAIPGGLFLNPEEIATSIVQGFAKDNGFKPERLSGNELRLTPEFKNSNLLKSIPVGDMNIKLEEIKSNPQTTAVNIDTRGDINFNFNGTKAIASSDSNSKNIARNDVEGSDILTTNIEASLGNDLTTNIKTSSSLKVNLTQAEKGDAAQRLKSLTGQDLSMSGELEVKNLQTNAKVSIDGKVELQGSQTAQVSGKNLQVDLGSNSVKIDSANGDLEFKQDGSKKIVTSNMIDIKGGIDSPTTSVNINKLKMAGDIIYDDKNKDKIRFHASDDKGVELSVSMTDKASKFTQKVENLNVRNTDVEIDTKQQKLSLIQKDGAPPVSLSKLDLGAVSLENVTYKGRIDYDFAKGKLDLTGQNVSFNGNLGEFKVDKFKGSGNLSYDPSKGITVSNINAQNVSGKIGSFDISSLKAKGEVTFDNNGNLLLGKVSSMELSSKDGLRVKGGASVRQNNGAYELSVSSSNPISLSYRPDPKTPRGQEPASNLSMQGKITIDPNNGSLSFNNADSPLKIKSGKIYGTEFKNVTAVGEIKNDNGNILIHNSKGDTKVSGNIAGINIKEISSNGSIKVNTSNMSVDINGENKVNLPDQKIDLNTSGNINIKQEKDGKLTITSNSGKISGKLGNTEVKDLVVDGNMTYDPKTNQFNFGAPTGKEIKINGFIQGKELDIATSGKFAVNSEKDGSTKISADNLNLKGKIEGFDIKTGEGNKGEIKIANNGTVTASGLNFDFNVDGISLKAVGDLNSTNKGYELNFSGSIKQDSANIDKFLDKLSKSSLVPEGSKESLQSLKENLARLNLKELDYENLNVSLGKDYSFNHLSVTATKANIDFPDKGWSIKSDGKATFELEKSGKMSLTLQNETINGSIGGSPLKNFKVNGKVTYDPNAGDIKFSGNGSPNFSVSGFLANKKVELNSNGDIHIKGKGKDLEFSADNINMNGELDGFKFQSLGPSKGKILLKEDGHIDLSNLNFKYKIDDLIITNRDGKMSGSDKGYDIQLNGNLDMTQASLLKFLDKVAKNESTPDEAKKVIQETLSNIRSYSVLGDFKDTKYTGLSLRLDRGLNFEGFDAKIDFKMENASAKMGIGANRNNRLNFGTINASATINMDRNEFNLKNGKIEFKLTQDVKNSIANETKNILQAYGLTEAQIEVDDNAKVKVKSAIFEGIPVFDVEVGGTAKFEGTEFKVTVDKAQLKGFFGRIAQGLAEGVFGVDAKSLGVKEALKRAEDLKVNYSGGSNEFSVDMKDMMYQHVGEDFELKNLSAKDGKFTMDYEVKVGEKTPYNPSRVYNTLQDIKSAKSSSQKEALSSKLLNLNTPDLSRVMDRSTLMNLKSVLGDDGRYSQLMRKVADSENYGRNKEHLAELTSYANDEIAKLFINQLKDEQISKISAESKAHLVSKLFDGNTTSEEEMIAKRIFTSSTPKDIQKMIDLITLKRMNSEFDKKDVTEILKIANSK